MKRSLEQTTTEQAPGVNRSINEDIFYNLARTVEDVLFELEDIQSCFQVFEENLGDEVQFLGRSEDGYATHFTARYTMYSGLLVTAIKALHGSRESLSSQFDEAWKAYRKELRNEN